MPGVFGHQSAIKDADAALALAEKHLKFRNFEAAKSQAVEVLQILQDGGWSIWGGLSRCSSRAEALLHEQVKDAADVIHCYGKLIEGERHEQKWKLAEHLVGKVANLLNEDERSLLLQYVIEHIRLMVGDATNEINLFSFLSEDPPCNPSVELFRFVLWLTNHPQSLRREKAAAMLVWLIETEPAYLEEAVKEAFSMATGYSGDILCGIFDKMSTRQPRDFWERLFALLGVEAIIRNCKHVGRLAVLHRIAERAGNTGSSSGAEVAASVLEKFRSGAIVLGSPNTHSVLPQWANCISREWKALNRLGLISDELFGRFEEELTQVCTPLDIQGAWNLEKAVSTSFREKPNRHLNRWEAKVRFALNTALLPYASKRNFREIESALRIFNPSVPERTLIPGFASSGDAVISAIAFGNDYAGAIGDAEYFFLNYHEVVEHREDGRMVYVEVLAVVVPSFARRGFFNPSIEASFSSRGLPDFSSVTTSDETCWHLEPDFAVFGSFTPAFPLPTFTDLIKAKSSDFFRINWRNGRSSDVRHFGRPLQEGCMLAVKRTAVRLPDGKKLAWILRLNGKTAAVVDLENAQLI